MLVWVLASATLLVALWHDAEQSGARRRARRVTTGTAQTAGCEFARRGGGCSPPRRRSLDSSPRSEDVFAHLFAQVSPLAAMLSAGLISIICYTGLVAPFPLSIYCNQPHITPESSQINDMGAITRYSPLAASSFVVVMLLLFGAQFIALLAASRAQRDERPMARRWIALLIFGAPVVFSAHPDLDAARHDD